MLVVRLRRIGKKGKPTYRVVVAEHSVAVSGSFVADIGFYNPHTKQISIDKDSVTAWMNKGAKPSNTVARLLEKEKVKHKSVVVIKYKKAPKKKTREAEPKAPAAPVADAGSEPTETAPADTAEVAPEANSSVEESTADLPTDEGSDA